MKILHDPMSEFNSVGLKSTELASNYFNVVKLNGITLASSSLLTVCEDVISKCESNTSKNTCEKLTTSGEVENFVSKKKIIEKIKRAFLAEKPQNMLNASLGCVRVSLIAGQSALGCTLTSEIHGKPPGGGSQNRFTLSLIFEDGGIKLDE